jgi:hypothetical protein
VSHERLKLVPQGVLPRDAGMKFRMQRALTPAELAAAEPLLVIDTETPVIAEQYSFFTVYTHDTRDSDLQVTLTSPGVSIIAWITGSPPAASPDTSIVVTIPAGRSDVSVPFFASTTGTDIVVTATASGYTDASIIFDIEFSPIYPVEDIKVDIANFRYTTAVRANVLTDHGITVSAGFGAYGGEGIEINANAASYGCAPFSTAGDEFIIACRAVPPLGVLLSPSRITWEIVVSDLNLTVHAGFGGRYGVFTTSGAGLDALFRVMGRVYSFSTGDFIPGVTMIITCLLDGLPVLNSRTTFTITIGV